MQPANDKKMICVYASVGCLSLIKIIISMVVTPAVCVHRTSYEKCYVMASKIDR